MTFTPSLSYLVFFIFGLILGSFFNVLIHRIPKSIQSVKNESFFSAISFPKSYCPKCKKGLFTIHNLPIISWLFLLGKCYFCKAKISIRYPLVELLSGFIFLFCFWQYALRTCMVDLQCALSVGECFAPSLRHAQGATSTCVGGRVRRECYMACRDGMCSSQKRKQFTAGAI